jgi:hypothetical protein
MSRLGELLHRFRSRPPSASIPRPARAPETNLAAVCHSLDCTRKELLASAANEATPAVRHAVAKALRSLEAALDCARGQSLSTLQTLVTRAPTPAFQRSFEKRLQSAGAHQAHELPKLLVQARTDVEAAMGMVRDAARQEIANAMERPVRLRRRKAHRGKAV